RLPLRLLQSGPGEEPRDPLGREVGVRRPEVVIEDGALGHALIIDYAWIAQPSTARAASSTASLTVGCGWTTRWSSCAPPSSAIVATSSAIMSQARLPTMWAPRISPYLASTTSLTMPSLSS